MRELALEKGRSHRQQRSGALARVVVEGEGGWALTEDYLRVEVAKGSSGSSPGSEDSQLHGGIRGVRLQGTGDHLYIDLSHPPSPI